ncbi:MAG: hypothetical protein E2O39_12845 [Planctomycetota bacterium]|nr:MAG: hypothetical protein E2O39_12845 [Planctomycetota bacterium]
MNQALWNRVEAALDARVDPFDDANLAADLAAEPGAERATRRLVARLARLDAPPTGAVTQGPARRVAAVAAAVLVVGGAALYVLRDARPATGRLRQPIGTVSLVVEHTFPPPARCARVVLEPSLVMEWTLEGVAP